MRIFKLKDFSKWAKKEKLTDEMILNAVEEIVNGLVEGHLGANLYKKRISPKGRGKRSSFRTVLAYKVGKSMFFMYGYSKNERENITTKEENALKKLAKLYITFDEAQINKSIKCGEIKEILK